MDNNSFINVCILRETETSTLPVAVGRTKPKEENHRPLIYQTLLLYQRVHLQDELVVLLEGLLLVVGVLLLFVQLLAHVLDQLLHGDDPEVRAPNLDWTPHQHMRAHWQNVSPFYRNIANRDWWKDNMFISMKANVRKIKRQHRILQAAQHRTLRAAPRKLSGRLSFHLAQNLAQNLRSRRQRAIRDRRANRAISKYMTRLIKSAAALHNILTHHFNEFHFSILDDKDVEAIELLHSFYPLDGLLVAHCWNNRLHQSFIRSSSEMGMAVLH